MRKLGPQERSVLGYASHGGTTLEDARLNIFERRAAQRLVQLGLVEIIDRYRIQATRAGEQVFKEQCCGRPKQRQTMPTVDPRTCCQKKENTVVKRRLFRCTVCGKVVVPDYEDWTTDEMILAQQQLRA